MKEELNDQVVEQEVAPTEEPQMDATPEEVPRLFERANFISSCSCGGKDIIIENTKDGVKLELYPTEIHEASVGCSKCGTIIKLHFEEIETMTNEEAQELVEKGEAEIPTEAVVENKEAKDEEPIHEENTESESV